MLRHYSAKEPFRFWCQKVLPLVYDDSLSYYEMLCKTVDYLNKMVTNVNSLGKAFNDLQDMVTNYFDNLDVQQEINNKLDEMVTDGTLNSLIEPLVGDAVSDWLEDNVTPTGSAVLVDSTLTISGASADAKVTGDEIGDLKSDLNDSLDVDPEIEIGINRFISNGKIIKANNANRASTDVKIVNTKKIIVIPNASGLYRVALFVCKNNVWSQVQSATNSKFSYTFTDEETYMLQVLCNSNIPQDAVPFRMFVNTPSYIDEKLDARTKPSLEIEIGTNRFISNGLLVTSSNANRASTAPKEALFKSFVVIPHPQYTVNLFVRRNGIWEEAVGNAINYFTYTFTDEEAYAFQVLYSDVIPQDAVPFVIDEINLAEYIEKGLNSVLKIPSRLTKYAYKGEPISVGHKIAYEQYMTISTETNAVVQGSTVYGKYLFVTYNTLPMISIYDMETKSHVANISMEAVSTYHCNNINFGSKKYDSSDYFPLLYISMENQAEHKCLVYRITENNGAYNATLVQTITYPSPAEANMYYPNCVIDSTNNLLCVMGYSTNSYIASESSSIKYNVYELPTLNDGNVQLNQADAIRSGSVKSISATQGAFIQGDNIIQVYGGPSFGDGSIYLGQISISASKYITLIRLNDIGITSEPESVFIYNGDLYILFVNKDVYRVFLD